MSENYIAEKTFTNTDIEKAYLTKGEYELCTFNGLDLKSFDLSYFTFIDCTFTDCDLSNTNLNRTALREVHFEKCKMLGLSFNHCNEFLFQVSFSECSLDLSSFYQCSLKKTKLINCSLKEVDFSEADLTAAFLDNSLLERAIFNQTILEKADFRSAMHFNIDPIQNRIRGAIFSRENVDGLLGALGIELT